MSRIPEEDRRTRGREFIRTDENFAALFDVTYENENWPNLEPTVGAVGSLAVWLMIREQPERFAAWVNAIKDGKDWQKALAEDYKFPRQALTETISTYFRVND